jgi:invasion protein IalB
VTVNAEGTPTKDAAITTSGGPIENDGTINLTSTDSSHGARLRASTGTITNIGTIATLAGAGGTRQLGMTIDNQGSLAIGADTASESNPNALDLTNSGALSVAAGATLTAEGLTVTGGTLTIDGTLDHSGSDLSVSGTLRGTGTVRATNLTIPQGTLHPGDSPGALTVDGNLSLAQLSTLDIEVEGSAFGDFSQLVVTGDVILDGTLHVTTTGAQSGDFRILDSTGQTNGEFADKQFTGQSYLVSVDPSGVTLIGPPANASKPAVTGTAKLGSTLSCSQGSWNGEVATFAFQWRRNGAPIAGATAATYKVAAADQGKKLSCTVTAANGAGSASSTSNTVSVPALLTLTKSGTFAKTTLTATKKGIVKVPVGNPNPVGANGTLTLKRKGKKVGRATFTIGAHGAATVKVKLNKKTRAALKKNGQLKISAILVLSKGGAAKTATAKLTVKRPKS